MLNEEDKIKAVGYSDVLNLQSASLDLNLSCDCLAIFGLTCKMHPHYLNGTLRTVSHPNFPQLHVFLRKPIPDYRIMERS